MDTPTTIDDLARMINEGFKTTATKEDIRAVNTRFDSVESRLDHLARAWEESRPMCTPCAMRWCIGRSFRMCLTV